MQKTKLKAARPQTKKTRLLACQDRVNFQVLFRFPSGQFNNWQCYLLLIYLGTVQLNDFIILRGYPEPPNNHVNFGYPPPICTRKWWSFGHYVKFTKKHDFFLRSNSA